MHRDHDQEPDGRGALDEPRPHAGPRAAPGFGRRPSPSQDAPGSVISGARAPRPPEPGTVARTIAAPTTITIQVRRRVIALRPARRAWCSGRHRRRPGIAPRPRAGSPAGRTVTSPQLNASQMKKRPLASSSGRMRGAIRHDGQAANGPATNSRGPPSSSMSTAVCTSPLSTMTPRMRSSRMKLQKFVPLGRVSAPSGRRPRGLAAAPTRAGTSPARETPVARPSARLSGARRAWSWPDPLDRSAGSGTGDSPARRSRRRNPTRSDGRARRDRPPASTRRRPGGPADVRVGAVEVVLHLVVVPHGVHGRACEEARRGADRRGSHDA